MHLPPAKAPLATADDLTESGVPALYTSLRLETAWLEAQQGLPFKAQPMTLCDYGVDCEDIADLTDFSYSRHPRYRSL